MGLRRGPGPYILLARNVGVCERDRADRAGPGEWPWRRVMATTGRASQLVRAWAKQWRAARAAGGERRTAKVPS